MEEKTIKKTTEPAKPKSEKKPNQLLPAVVLGINLILMVADILLLTLLPRKAKQAVTLRSEILAHSLQEQSAKKLAVDLKEAQDEKEKLFAALPTEARLLEVINVLENLKEVTTVNSFAFTEEKPVKSATGHLYLPLSLNLEGSLSQTMTALSRLKKAPFLFRIEHVVIGSPSGLSQPLKVNVLLGLYVSDPFAKN